MYRYVLVSIERDKCMQYVYMGIDTCNSFRDHLRESCTYDVPLSLKTLEWVSKNKVILLHNCSAVTKIGENVNIDAILLSNS